MKKQFLFLSLMIFLLSSLSAQVNTKAALQTGNKQKVKTATKSNNPAKPKYDANKAIINNNQANNPNAPIITFDKTTHDYGTIKHLADGNCVFKFTNDGKEPLILSNVRSSCGCTTPNWPKNPILPGETSEIKVRYDTKRNGTFKKNIYVHSNATVERITLTIQGTVEAEPGAVMPEKKNATSLSTKQPDKK